MIWWFKKAKKSTKFFFVWFWLLPYFIKKNIMKFFPSNFSFLYFTLSINKFILFHFFYFILISGNLFSFQKCLIFNLCVFGIVLRVLFLVLITSVILCVCVVFFRVYSDWTYLVRQKWTRICFPQLSGTNIKSEYLQADPFFEVVSVRFLAHWASVRFEISTTGPKRPPVGGHVM